MTRPWSSSIGWLLDGELVCLSVPSLRACCGRSPELAKGASRSKPTSRQKTLSLFSPLAGASASRTQNLTQMVRLS